MCHPSANQSTAKSIVAKEDSVTILRILSIIRIYNFLLLLHGLVLSTTLGIGPRLLSCRLLGRNLELSTHLLSHSFCPSRLLGHRRSLYWSFDRFSLVRLLGNLGSLLRGI